MAAGADKYDPYSGDYTRGLIATSQRGNGFLQGMRGTDLSPL